MVLATSAEKDDLESLLEAIEAGAVAVYDGVGALFDDLDRSPLVGA